MKLFQSRKKLLNVYAKDDIFRKDYNPRNEKLRNRPKVISDNIEIRFGL
jgi:hypothetical protein